VASSHCPEVGFYLNHYISSTWRIFEIPAGGGQAQQLVGTTANAADADSPHFSRDGSKLYYRRTTPFNAGGSDIYVADAAGMNEVKLTTLPSNGANHPTDILVNGLEKIIFPIWDPALGNSAHIMLMDPIAGAPLTQLTQQDNIGEVEPMGPAGNVPASVEGTFLFTRQSGSPNVNTLVLMGSDGTVLLDPAIADAREADWWIP